MSKLNWSDDLETKVAQIDTYNQSLFFVLNELFASDYPCEMRSKMCHKIEDTIVYLTKNFLREEALMAEGGYPNLEDHKREHRVFLDELLRLQRTLECGHYDTSEMLDLLSSWALAHIEIWDKPFGRHLHLNSPNAASVNEELVPTGTTETEHAEVSVTANQ